MSTLFTKLFAIIFLAFSCSKKSSDNDNGTTTANVVKGKVTDGAGRPLKDVSILIDNTLFYNTYLSGSTSDDGTYQIKLTNGSWQAYAEMDVAYNDKTYKVNLHPDNNQGFGIEGGIRNFQWKLTGKKAEPLTGVYGGIVIVDSYIGSSIYDPENIEFTLMPVGKLIDGSTGQMIKMKLGQPRTDTYGKLYDLPIGRYTATAVYQSSTGNVPLKLRDKIHNPSGAFSTSLQLDFEPTTSDGNNMAAIEYREN